LIAAEEVFQQRALSKVIFVPTGISPHKESHDLADAYHRYNMVKEAIGDNEHFEISDIEMKRSGKSYTIDTVRFLREIYGEENTLYLILGTDMIEEINSWKDIELLSGMCSFVVVNRGISPMNKNHHRLSYSTEELKGIEIFSGGKKLEIEKLKVTIPPIGISSSEIRERLGKGRSIRYLVPKCVENYITAHNLYVKGPNK
jgi:nicotinate-nucleotide adenylyltransferase